MIGSRTKSLAPWKRRGNGISHHISVAVPSDGGGEASDCYRLGRRVTSATCADGCATAVSGANRKMTSQGRRVPPLCNPNFPIPRLVRPTLTGSPISRRTRKLKRNLKLLPTSRNQPVRQVESTNLRSSSGATATGDAADAAVVAVHSRPPKPPASRARVVPQEKRVRPRSGQRLANRRQLLGRRLVRRRHTRPGSRRVQ